MVLAAAGWSGVLLLDCGTKEGSARVESASQGHGVKDRADYLLTKF